jgi:formate hydrogenlyase transcriptional activator
MSLASEYNQELTVIKNAKRSEMLSTGLNGLGLQSFAVRNKQELNELIQQVVREFSDLDTMFINLLTEDSQSHSTYFYYSREAPKVDTSFKRIMGSLYPVKDGLFEMTLKNDFPVIWNMDEIRQWEKVPERVQNCNEPDLSIIVGLSLSDGVRKIGNMYWAYKDPAAVSDAETETMRLIGPYIGNAIANLQHMEGRLRKLEEAEATLTFTNILFSVRDKTALISAINSGLRNFTNFNGVMIVLNEPQENPLDPYILYFDENKTSKYDDGPADPRRQKCDLQLLNHIFSAKEAIKWLMADLTKMEPRPDFITRHRINNEIKKVMAMPLSDGGIIKGAIFLFCDDPGAFASNELKLMNTLSSHISKAVANVRFLEEVAKKDEERSIFMSITKALAIVKNGDQLQQALRKVFMTINCFEEGFIYTFPPASGIPSTILFKQTNDKILNDKGLPVQDLGDEPDSFLESLKKLSEITIIEPDEYFRGGITPAYISHWKANRVCTIVATPFSDGGAILGIMFFLSTDASSALTKNIPLVGGMVVLIAAAVNNLIAKERLTDQLNEINHFKGQLEIQNIYLQEEIQTTFNYSEIIGTSAQMREVFHMVSQVAKTNSSVLILGETGTGKELIARAIHNTSQRKGKVMIKINCGALPPNLIESELFGHERGSFTGATERRIGKFELANNSTIFLDEIGELPIALQVKLLRALQEKEIERIGGKAPIKVDLRVIAATNRDLLKDVQQGNFRGDLYFRLNVFPIYLPSLRERKEDIPVLANHFAVKYAKKLTIGQIHFTSKVMKQMVAYNWPGNVRELEHLVERSVLLAKGRIISQVYLPGTDEHGEDIPLKNSEVKTLDEIEREHIISVLKMVNGKISGVGGAAEMLKIAGTTLASKIVRLKIKKGIS